MAKWIASGVAEDFRQLKANLANRDTDTLCLTAAILVGLAGLWLTA